MLKAFAFIALQIFISYRSEANYAWFTSIAYPNFLYGIILKLKHFFETFADLFLRALSVTIFGTNKTFHKGHVIDHINALNAPLMITNIILSKIFLWTIRPELLQEIKVLKVKC